MNLYHQEHVCRGHQWLGSMPVFEETVYLTLSGFYHARRLPGRAVEITRAVGKPSAVAPQ
jgi:hypothetical protein